MANRLDKIAKLTEGLGQLAAPAPPPAPQYAGGQKKRPPTVPVNLRMPPELATWFVTQAAARSAEAGRTISAQAVMLEALQDWQARNG